MKKLISVVLILCICAAVFTACTKENENGKETDTMSFETIYKEKAAELSDHENPVAVIVMEDGSTIAFELYPDKAPNTVNNFISLANKGFYDGLIFHRVIDYFMIQGGDPNGNGSGGPGYQIAGEFANNGYANDIAHEVGVVSMARRGNPYNPASAYNTAGSQFFICVDDRYLSNLDRDYAAFGRVIDGMDAVLKIANVPTDGNDKPYEDQKMAYVRVDTHGVTFAEPETLPE